MFKALNPKYNGKNLLNRHIPIYQAQIPFRSVIKKEGKTPFLV